MSINTVRTHAQTHAHSYAYVQDGKGVFDHTEEIKDEKKRAAVLALMAEYSVLCAVATGKADLVAAAVAKGCTVHETDQVDRYACMCMCVCVCVCCICIYRVLFMWDIHVVYAHLSIGFDVQGFRV